MPGERTKAPFEVDRSGHLTALHQAWVTPSELVVALIAETTSAPVLDTGRIVAGEGNEVYDVTHEGAPPVIVKIAHGGPESHDREAWALAQCASRGIQAPRLHLHRHVEVGDERRSVIVMEKLAGERLSDLDPAEVDLRAVLKGVGSWLRELHSIPVQGFGYVDGSGTGKYATLEDWLTGFRDEARVFEEAGRSVGLETATVQSWVREVFDSFQAVPPRITFIHNDLLADHVLIQDGQLSGIIDFGEVAAEPAVSEFAKWHFNEGDRLPVQWIQAGYGDPSLFESPNDRNYHALWVATGLWHMAWYFQTGFRAGVEAGRNRLLSGPEQP